MACFLFCNIWSWYIQLVLLHTVLDRNSIRFLRPSTQVNQTATFWTKRTKCRFHTIFMLNATCWATHLHDYTEQKDRWGCWDSKLELGVPHKPKRKPISLGIDSRIAAAGRACNAGGAKRNQITCLLALTSGKQLVAFSISICKISNLRPNNGCWKT